MTPISAFTNQAFSAWADKNLSACAHVVSDGLQCFRQVTQLGASHERHVTGGGKQAAQKPQLRWVNTLLGNLKTALAGTYYYCVINLS